MPILNAVAVRDEAMQAFNRPFFVVTLGQAIRSFEDEVNRSADDNPMYRHSKDFSLWHIGTYDEESGRLTSLEIPIRISDANSVISGGSNHASPQT